LLFGRVSERPSGIQLVLPQVLVDVISKLGGSRRLDQVLLPFSPSCSSKATIGKAFPPEASANQ
jgi:hypothetical protein